MSQTYRTVLIQQKYEDGYKKERSVKSELCKILIDGRARAYCALEVYDYLKDDGLLFVHDYIGRKKYHPIIEGRYEKINLVNSLVIFKKK